jgi:hypothetical protein
MEVAGLALGAIPVILEAIKGYRETYEHIQNFKHATRQLQVVDAQFRVCRLNFLSECRLLLDLVVSDPQLSQEMVVDTQHRMWYDDTIAEHMVSQCLRHYNRRHHCYNFSTRLEAGQSSDPSSKPFWALQIHPDLHMIAEKFE